MPSADAVDVTVSPTPTSNGIRRGDALLHQRQQRFGIVWSRSHIERLTQGRFTPTALDVLIEQHQKAASLMEPVSMN